MAFDKRQNLLVPSLSEEDAKDPSKIAQWTSIIALKLNQLRTPRIAVRTLKYVFNQNANGLGPLVKLQDLGFTPGAVVLGAINPIASTSSSVEVAPAQMLILSGVTAIGNTLQFYLRDDTTTATSPFNGTSFQIVLVIFEKDSINPLTANSQSNVVMRALTGR